MNLPLKHGLAVFWGLIRDISHDAVLQQVKPVYQLFPLEWGALLPNREFSIVCIYDIVIATKVNAREMAIKNVLLRN